MDFQGLQADARSESRRLTVVFSVAVGVVAVVGAAAVTASMMAMAWVFGLFALSAGPEDPASGWSGRSDALVSATGWVFVMTVMAVAGFISMLTWQRRRAIEKGGGRAVARRLGGRMVDPENASGAELRFCNAVAEIAVAAGRPAPEVWVLEGEHSLNVFNAGWSDDTTVIGITAGALVGLDRDELQAVAAQAMSHVLHGDARLNLRLMAMVAGIAGLVIVGDDFIERAKTKAERSRFGDDEGGIGDIASLVVGTVLQATGWVGLILATSIQQSIASRHELLADATAVELTRDAGAMSDALRRIGGHPVRGRIGRRGHRALNHLFLVDSRGRGRGTVHPPLALRIKRLDPLWEGGMLEPVGYSDGTPSTAHASAEPAAPAGVDDPFGLVHFDAFSPAAPAFDAMLAGGTADAGSAAPGEAFHDAVSVPTVEAVAAGQRDGGAFAAEIASASWSPVGCRAIMVALAGVAAGVTDAEALSALTEGRAPTEPDFAEHLETVAPAVQATARPDRATLVALAARQAMEGEDDIVVAYRRGVIELLDQTDTKVLDCWLLAHQMRYRVERRAPARRTKSLEQLRGPYAEILTFISVIARSDLTTTVSVAGYAAGLGTIHPRNPNQIDLRTVDRALDKIRRVDDDGRRRFVDGLLAAVGADNRVTAMESDLVQAIAVAVGAEVPVLTT